MTPTDRDRVRILHMLEATERALELSRGKPLADLPPEHETALAVVRLLEILGEAARAVSNELKTRYPELPWREMAGLRNRLVHEYFEVDMAIVATIVEKELPPLRHRLHALLKRWETP